MAVVDADYKFLTVDIGAYGSTSDGGTFKSSDFGHALQNEKVDFPPTRVLPGSDPQTPHVLLGDDAFQLLPTFMKPYPNKELDTMKRIFNYLLSRARRCSENAFGILASRWRIFRNCLQMQPRNVDWVVKATVVLHNFLIEEEAKTGNKIYCPNGYADSLDSLGNIMPGEWHNELRGNPANAFQDVLPTTARNYTIEANDVRTAFANYFMSDEGEEEWQWNIPGVNKPS